MIKGLFATDLDRTLIFSKRMLEAYPSDLPLQLVERVSGRDISYIPLNTTKALSKLSDNGVLVVPVTARSIGTYKGIDFGIEWKPTYAITSCGGVVLLNGERLDEWETEIDRVELKSKLRFIEEAMQSTVKSISHTPKILDDSYIFLRLPTNQLLKERCQDELRQLGERIPGIRIVFKERKAHIVPLEVSKERALSWLRDKLGAERVYAAGDSEDDLGMLKNSDVSFSPIHGELIKEGRFKPDFLTPAGLDGISWMIKLISRLSLQGEQGKEKVRHAEF